MNAMKGYKMFERPRLLAEAGALAVSAPRGAGAQPVTFRLTTPSIAGPE